MQGLLLAGRYRLVDTIGSGGMGRVWRARDEVLHRAVAVKELTAALYVTDSERGRLFARTDAEARAAARINHSAVVTVHDVLDHDNRPWIVMELVEGASLADAVKERERVDSQEAARIGLWVLRALSAAHDAGVLHRDVKPGNVLLAEDGRVLLTDFGIAQVEGDTTITKTGEIVGSVDYIAPERVRGQDPGRASDLWALGATLYTAVEGKSPFRRTTPLTTMQAVVDEDPAEPAHAGPLGPVITALLRKDPAERPGMAETEQMLAEAAEGRWPLGAQAYVPTTHHVATRHGATHHGATPYGTNGHTAPGHTAPGHIAPGHTAPGHTAPGHSYGADTPVSGHYSLSQPPMATGTGTGTATGTPPPPGNGKRRRGRTFVLVVALAALIGGGTAVVLQKWDEQSRNGASATPSSSPSASQSPKDDADGTLPDGWVRRTDPAGFSLPLPDKTWKRQVFDANQTDYTPDGGEHFIRIAVDDSPDFDDPKLHQIDLEEQISQRLVDYERVTMEVNTYRDRRGSLWEYTWTALAKDTPFPGPRRAIEETYIARDGVEYAIYMSAPAEDWATARKQFDTILRGWRPAGQ
ncbi:serine/threonine-protein kinase [Streptomyces spongiae]|uniref:non-specific serine/threonine protein kinase n=1 Tax=Streptomyces spongiae TaxID=565072 RepID=A0A5N8XWT3_9ACTN|nr:serine/threonine-protein kinase [Streptomyces spongiae]MPY63833.1 serine/threonine protein kinase [Streptomyces spongiae]